jgi:hypothetical protein
MSSRTRIFPVSATRNAGRTSGTLLASGIDVYTTLNVANIESPGPAVSRITGVRPAEPVPDAFVRAGKIKLLDLAPAALRRRLAHGLVVPKEQVDAALSNYFLFANLAALRELARLWLDDSVPDPAAAFAAAHGISEPVQAIGSAPDLGTLRASKSLREPGRAAASDRDCRLSHDRIPRGTRLTRGQWPRRLQAAAYAANYVDGTVGPHATPTGTSCDADDEPARAPFPAGMSGRHMTCRYGQSRAVGRLGPIAATQGAADHRTDVTVREPSQKWRSAR